jgi:hypothetical protein
MSDAASFRRAIEGLDGPLSLGSSSISASGTLSQRLWPSVSGCTATLDEAAAAHQPQKPDEAPGLG